MHAQQEVCLTNSTKNGKAAGYAGLTLTAESVRPLMKRALGLDLQRRDDEVWIAAEESGRVSDRYRTG